MNKQARQDPENEARQQRLPLTWRIKTEINKVKSIFKQLITSSMTPATAGVAAKEEIPVPAPRPKEQAEESSVEVGIAGAKFTKAAGWENIAGIGHDLAEAAAPEQESTPATRSTDQANAVEASCELDFSEDKEVSQMKLAIPYVDSASDSSTSKKREEIQPTLIEPEKAETKAGNKDERGLKISTETAAGGRRPLVAETDDLDSSSSELPCLAPGKLGETLRQARNSRGLSTAEVAEDTRISRKYIAALELENFDCLPQASIYVKSYLKTLARRYGLGAEDLLAEYEKCLTNSPRPKPKVTELARTNEGPEPEAPENELIMVIWRAVMSAVTAARSGALHSWAMAAVVTVVLIILAIAGIKAGFSGSASFNRNDLSIISEQDLEQFILPETLPFSELEIPRGTQHAAGYNP